MTQKKGLFQDLRVKPTSSMVPIKVSTLVVGGDHWAAELAYFHLVEKNVDLLLLSSAQKTIALEDGWRFNRPSTYRGEANWQGLTTLEHTLGNHDFSLGAKRTAMFFKDQKFRFFHGRMRPEKLLPGEAFFSTPAIDYDYQKHLRLSAIGEEGLVTLAPITCRNNLERIELLTINGQRFWQITASNGEIFHGEKIYWGQGIPQFFSKLEPKESYSLAMANYLARWQISGALRVRFIFQLPITDQGETLFFPLSYSEEQGHFVGEFLHEGEKQVLEVVHFFDPDVDNEEIIAKKIHLLKRQLAKIFPHFTMALTQESIQLGNCCLNEIFDDPTWAQLSSQLPGIYFFGTDAPLPAFANLDTRQITGDTRALIALYLAKQLC